MTTHRNSRENMQIYNLWNNFQLCICLICIELSLLFVCSSFSFAISKNGCERCINHERERWIHKSRLYFRSSQRPKHEVWKIVSWPVSRGLNSFLFLSSLLLPSHPIALINGVLLTRWRSGGCRMPGRPRIATWPREISGPPSNGHHPASRIPQESPGS